MKQVEKPSSVFERTKKGELEGIGFIRANNGLEISDTAFR